MTSLSTPLHITVLIHCHTTPSRHPHFSAPAVQDAINFLLEQEAIYWLTGDGKDCFRTTEKGRAWIASLCSVPPPVPCWKDGATGKLIES